MKFNVCVCSSASYLFFCFSPYSSLCSIGIRACIHIPLSLLILYSTCSSYIFSKHRRAFFSLFFFTLSFLLYVGLRLFYVTFVSFVLCIHYMLILLGSFFTFFVTSAATVCYCCCCSCCYWILFYCVWLLGYAPQNTAECIEFCMDIKESHSGKSTASLQINGKRCMKKKILQRIERKRHKHMKIWEQKGIWEKKCIYFIAYGFLLRLIFVVVVVFWFVACLSYLFAHWSSAILCFCKPLGYLSESNLPRVISHYKILMRYNDDVDGGIEWALMHIAHHLFFSSLLSISLWFLLYCSVTKSLSQIAMDAKEVKRYVCVCVHVVGDVFVRFFSLFMFDRFPQKSFFSTSYARLSPSMCV